MIDQLYSTLSWLVVAFAFGIVLLAMVGGLFALLLMSGKSMIEFAATAAEMHPNFQRAGADAGDQTWRVLARMGHFTPGQTSICVELLETNIYGPGYKRKTLPPDAQKAARRVACRTLAKHLGWQRAAVLCLHGLHVPLPQISRHEQIKALSQGEKTTGLGFCHFPAFTAT